MSNDTPTAAGSDPRALEPKFSTKPCVKRASPPPPTRRLLRVEYLVGSAEQAVAQTLAGGLVVTPPGVGMPVDLLAFEEYRQTIQSAALASTDSGYMILLCRLLPGEKLPGFPACASSALYPPNPP